ncbi:sensor histidine kinase [Mucilaginibacter xinganensis]|nr:histidine kinase [Mucilaginibacter xinganensis]
MKTMKLLIQKIALITTLVAMSIAAAGQITTMEHNNKLEVYDHYKLIDTLHATPDQLAKVHQLQKIKQLTKDHYYYDFPYARNLGIRFNNDGKTKSEVYEGRDWGDDKFYKSIIIDGDCSIELAALDITEKNAADYRYRVVQNDNQELTTWKVPATFKNTSDKRFKYAYLGQFKYAPGQVLKVEIYNVKNFKQQDAMLIDWRKVEAAKVGATIQYISRNFHIPDNGLISYPMNMVKHGSVKKKSFFFGKERVFTRPASLNFIETTASNDIKLRLGDSLQNISFDIGNGQRLYNYRISLKREIDGYTDSIDFGETNDKLVLYKEFWKNPGKYSITFTPKIHKHGGEPILLLHNLATSISFTTLPALDTTHSIPLRAVILMAFITAFIIVLLFTYYRQRQKRTLEAEAQNRQIATLQLQSVRSQLNPHFMFNALAGIQNLMNKNEIELANKYLARFARITRNVLDDGNKELTSIEHETDLLNDYLQMEQLRFGFAFDINVDDIDQQIEIPAMLLQPFVENAVKHGVSTLKDKGKITVGIAKNNADLILTVADNGGGFIGETTTGMGIKLCKERIKLLNGIYKNSSILLHKNVQSNNGTLITIELKNWL